VKGLPQLRGNWRLGVWGLLCVLTLLIFLYPAQLHYEYAIIQSLSVFPNLPLFGALYYVWFAVILVLIFLPGSEGKRRDWENIALLGLFIFVFSGIWVILTRGANGEFLTPATQTKYIIEKGYIPNTLPDIGETDFPGLPLLLAGVRLITGLETFSGIAYLVLVNLLVYSIILYAMFRMLFKKPSLAAASSLIMLMGSRQVSISLPQLHARGFGLVLFVALLLLFFRKQNLNKSVLTIVLSLILFAALTITHLATAMVFILVLVGIYITGKLRKQNLIDLSIIIILLVIMFSWQTYVALNTTKTLTDTVLNGISNLIDGEPISDYLVFMTGSYFGATSTPVWVNFVRFFWLLLSIGSGGIIAMLKLFKIRKLSLPESNLVGGLVGLGIFVIIMLAFTGLDEGIRALYYVPIFAVPIMLAYLTNIVNIVKRYILVIAAILVIIISVPTFLVHNDRVGVSAVYPQEISMVSFLRSNYGGGKGLNVAGDTMNQRLIVLNMENVNYASILGFNIPYFAGQDPLQLTWNEIEKVIKHFEDTPEAGINNSLFLYSPRLPTSFEYLLRADPLVGSQWKGFISRLNQQSIIYDNGFVEVYRATATK
jgi:hypothetical protein